MIQKLDNHHNKINTSKKIKTDSTMDIYFKNFCLLLFFILTTIRTSIIVKITNND